MNVVRQFLMDYGLSPGQLAEELGLPRNQLSRLIAGEEEPDRLIENALIGLATKLKKKPAKTSGISLPTHSLPDFLDGDSWANKTARGGLVLLVERIEKGEGPLSYKEFYDELASRTDLPANIGRYTKMAVPCGRMAGAMGEASDRLDEDVPPITSLIVNGVSGMPSDGIDGFIKEYLGREATRGLKNADTRKEIVEKLWAEVLAYPRWRDVLSALGLTGDLKHDV